MSHLISVELDSDVARRITANIEFSEPIDVEDARDLQAAIDTAFENDDAEDK